MTAQVAYLLPGQGAQAPGMGKAFYDRFEQSKSIYQRANEALGFDVAALCFEGPAEELTKTERCQPALFVTSIAAYAAFQQVLPKIHAVGAAGLSLGELTALTVADALTFKDALYLVQARAEAMAECTAHHAGGMLAVVGLTEETIAPLCQESGATAANVNAPDQIVLSGTEEAIAKVQEMAKAHGAKRALKLDVAGAFHSPLMKPAAEAFRAVVEKVTIRPPQLWVVSNVTGKAVRDPAQIRTLLVKQIVSPVRWHDSMQALIRAGATHFLEFPPAKVLTALLRRIDKSQTGIPIDVPDDLDRVAGELATSVST